MQNNNKVSFFPRLISFLVLVVFIAFHVIPIPLFETLGLYIVLKKQIYSEDTINSPDEFE